MNAQITVSTKGQVVIPKDVRDRFGFDAGERLDVVERPDGVLLRKTAREKGDNFEEITSKIRSILKYNGPRVSVEEMHDAVAEMWASGGPKYR
jgi:AbrB family looped-hinge helix DNA binding protein